MKMQTEERIFLAQIRKLKKLLLDNYAGTYSTIFRVR